MPPSEKTSIRKKERLYQQDARRNEKGRRRSKKRRKKYGPSYVSARPRPGDGKVDHLGGKDKGPLPCPSTESASLGNASVCCGRKTTRCRLTRLTLSRRQMATARHRPCASFPLLFFLSLAMKCGSHPAATGQVFSRIVWPAPQAAPEYRSFADICADRLRS